MNYFRDTRNRRTLLNVFFFITGEEWKLKIPADIRGTAFPPKLREIPAGFPITRRDVKQSVCQRGDERKVVEIFSRRHKSFFSAYPRNESTNCLKMFWHKTFKLESRRAKISNGKLLCFATQWVSTFRVETLIRNWRTFPWEENYFLFG